MVQNRASKMAEERAQELGIPVERLSTSSEEMAREFVKAEEAIAGEVREVAIKLDRSALTMHDVGVLRLLQMQKGCLVSKEYCRITR